MSPDSADSPVHVLMVEDNPGDARLLCEYLSKSDLPMDLRVASDGEEALARLRREGEFTGDPETDLVLLDLNLPRMDGREVLRRVKSHPEWKSIPVVVLTSSSAPSDLRACEVGGAEGYLLKPMGSVEFRSLARAVEMHCRAARARRC